MFTRMLYGYSTFCQTLFFRPIGLLTVSLLLTLTPLATHAQQAPPAHDYPRTVLYQGILHPIVTFSQDAPVVNFKNFYQVGFPVGVNIWKTAKIGYSLEIVPFIRSEAGVSRVNNVLFHPGVLVGLGKGFTLANRLAFETGGRYGVTPVLNKTFRRPGPVSYFLAIPLPVRFGNDRPTSVTIGFQFGLAF
ncbi:hypothetical protein [Fibrella aestuarina]|nr:hypothetical protein [Fibrella aestuarina]